ncbi:hypothetical protein TNCV_3822911 [Trichonephila clavipes]|nr:hypothetical protein TNCV_3822911 [Trichonephila clavipes]
MRREHNKDQFDPEEVYRNNSTVSTPRSKEDQAAGIPEAEEVSNSIDRRGQEERSVKNPTHLKSYVEVQGMGWQLKCRSCHLTEVQN